MTLLSNLLNVSSTIVDGYGKSLEPTATAVRLRHRSAEIFVFNQSINP